MKCNKCGTEMPQGAKFCVKCGTKYDDPQASHTHNCMNCGGLIEPGDIYCGYCGIKIGTEPAAVAAPANDKKICPNCSLLLDQRETVCHNCGFDFNATSADFCAAPAAPVACQGEDRKDLNAFDVVRGGIAAYAIGTAVSDAITVHKVTSEARAAIDGEPYDMSVIEDAFDEMVASEESEGLVDSIFDIFG